MTLDLRAALYFCKNENKNGKKYSIGIVGKNFGGLAVSYQEGEIVVFREGRIPSEESEQMQNPSRTVTVEKPYSLEEMKKRQEEGKLILSHSTTVGVPRSRIEEILIE